MTGAKKVLVYAKSLASCKNDLLELMIVIAIDR
jgi:hypothetical protein